MMEVSSIMLGFGKSSAKIPSWSVPALGYTISIGCLIWVLQGVDLKAIVQDIQSLHWGWVVLGVAADIGVYIYQAFRWNLLLKPVAKAGLWRSVQAIYVGLFANEVLPLRPGEVIRSFLQARWSEVPFSVAFSSALVERIFDGIWLIAVFVVLSGQMTAAGTPMPPVMGDLAKILGVVVVIFALLLGLVMFWKHHAHRACPKTKWGQHLRVLIDDLHLMGQSPTFYAAAAASLPYLLLQAIPIYALMQAYDLQLGVGPALVVLVLWRLGTSIPQAPGNVGASQAAMVLALSLFGVDKTTATGVSMVTWGVITLPLLLGGFVALALTGSKIGELRDHAAQAHALHQPVMAAQSEPSKS